MLNQLVKGLLAEKLLHSLVFFLNFTSSLFSLHILLMLFFKNFSKFVMFNPFFRLLKLLLLLGSLHFEFSQNLVIPFLLFELTHAFLRIQASYQGLVWVIWRVWSIQIGSGRSRNFNRQISLSQPIHATQISSTRPLPIICNVYWLSQGIIKIVTWESRSTGRFSLCQRSIWFGTRWRSTCSLASILRIRGTFLRVWWLILHRCTR